MAGKDTSLDDALRASIKNALASADIQDRTALLSGVLEEAKQKGKNLRDPLYRELTKLVTVYKTNPSLSVFIGQEAMKSDILKRIEVAKRRSQPVPHLLLCGPREMGKATLARAIAIEVGANIRSATTDAFKIDRLEGMIPILANQTNIKYRGDLAALVTNLEEGDILLIEEIERLNESVLEVLMQAAGDFQVAVQIGEEQIEFLLDLKRFTLIGTTSRASQVDKRLRRWMIVYDLKPYTASEIGQIIQLIAKRENLTIDSEAAIALAEQCAGCPGNARAIVKRVRDYFDPNARGHLTVDLAQQALLSFGYLGKPSVSTDLASKVEDMNALEFGFFAYSYG